MLAILTLGYVYYRTITSADPLASIGLVSFAGVAQFLPALLGGVFWRGATKPGAPRVLLAGFAFWIVGLQIGLPSYRERVCLSLLSSVVLLAFKIYNY